MPTALGLTTDKSASKDANPPGPAPRLDTISKRNHAAARQMETLLWRALVDDPAAAARDYVAPDCVMVNPVLAPRHVGCAPLGADTRPTAAEALAQGARRNRLVGFRFHGEPMVVEVGLMAVALVYKLSLFELGRKGAGQREIVATASSTWRQTAGADWFLVAMHVQFADEEDEEDEEEVA